MNTKRIKKAAVGGAVISTLLLAGGANLAFAQVYDTGAAGSMSAGSIVPSQTIPTTPGATGSMGATTNTSVTPGIPNTGSTGGTNAASTLTYDRGAAGPISAGAIVPTQAVPTTAGASDGTTPGIPNTGTSGGVTVITPGIPNTGTTVVTPGIPNTGTTVISGTVDPTPGIPNTGAGNVINWLVLGVSAAVVAGAAGFLVARRPTFLG